MHSGIIFGETTAHELAGIVGALDAFKHTLDWTDGTECPVTKCLRWPKLSENGQCPPSAHMGQFEVFAQRRVSGSS